MNKETQNQKVDSTVDHDVKKEGIRDAVGGAMEKLGHKISDAGAPGLGQKIHDLGDKIEADHSNAQHPHKA